MEETTYHHIKTNRKFRSVRGLAGLSWVTAEFLVIFQCPREFPLKLWGLNPKPDSSAKSTRTRKGAHITSGYEKPDRNLAGFLSTRERQLET